VGDKVPVEQQVRELVRSCVRAGLLDDGALHAEVASVVSADLPDLDPAATARDWVAAARDELTRDQEGWPGVTDYDRLQSAFTELAALDLVVLQGCADHWVAKAALVDRAAAGRPARGAAWFTPPDVWHAIDEGMLEVNVWHGDTANVVPGDGLLDEVVAVFARHDLPAHFDEGRIEVTAHWQRRLGQRRLT
jgi:hypothetical protein